MAGFDESFCSALWAHPVQPLVIIKVDRFVLQVQPAGLSLPERRHHAKPTFWCESLFQRPLLQVNWMFFFFLLFCFYHASLPLNRLCRLNCSRIVTMFATGGGGILTQEDRVTADGLQEIFMTNLFGHFLLVSHGDPCKILLNADKKKCIPQLCAWLGK